MTCRQQGRFWPQGAVQLLVRVIFVPHLASDRVLVCLVLACLRVDIIVLRKNLTCRQFADNQLTVSVLRKCLAAYVAPDGHDLTGVSKYHF